MILNVVFSCSARFFFFFLNDPPPTEISPLPLHDALPILRAGAAGVVLRPPEVRHEVLVAPADAAVLVLPGLEVVPVTADVDHRVDAAGPAQDLAARPVDGAAARAMLRNGQVVPVVRGLEQPVHRGGGADLVGVVGEAGLQQQHADARIGGQARRQDAAGAAGTNDDVVIHGGLLRDKGNNTRRGVWGACGGSGPYLVRYWGSGGWRNWAVRLRRCDWAGVTGWCDWSPGPAGPREPPARTSAMLTLARTFFASATYGDSN